MSKSFADCNICNDELSHEGLHLLEMEIQLKPLHKIESQAASVSLD